MPRITNERPIQLKLRQRGRGGVWHLRGTIGGTRIEESTGTADKALANAIRIRREGELQARRVHGPKASASFAEAVNLYLDQGGSPRFLPALLSRFGRTPLKAIGQTEIDAAAIALLPTAKPATRNRQVYTPMSAVLAAAHQAGLCDPVKLKRPKTPVTYRPAAEPEQLQLFLFGQPATPGRPAIAPAPDRLAALALFLAFTGRRPSDAVRLTWRHVTLARGEAVLPHTKNGEPEFVYLREEVVAALANLPGGRDDAAPVFGFTRREQLFRAWKRRALLCGLTLTPHEMGRHTFATWLRRYAAADLKTIMTAGGWKSINSVMRYVKVKPLEAEAAVDRLPSPIKKPA